MFVGVKSTDIIFGHFPSVIGDYKPGRIKAVGQVIQGTGKMLLLRVAVKSGNSQLSFSIFHKIIQG